jgi:hypothetical protein
MKKIRFGEHVLPHAIAILTFLIVTIFFFKPVFFDKKNIKQNDIIQFQGLAKELNDYREQTGEEALWAGHSFSGMPAYLITVQWGYKSLSYIKRIMSLGLPHPITNIFLAFVCYYILLLTFKVRPYLAIAGALAFGLSSYMIIGLSAGHNARIGAIAFMPLLVAGIHLVFSGKRVLGFGVATLGTALHLKENHLQITYYLLMMIAVYGIVQLIYAIKEKKLVQFAQSLGVLIPAALIAAASMTGPLWAVSEYSRYSTRGKSDLVSTTNEKTSSGVSKEYAFQYSSGLLEPMTVLIPDFYGGSSSQSLVSDPKSKTYQALVQSQNQQQANQLANYASAYWGEQPFTAPYYAGAIVCALFVLAFFVVERKYLWWLVSVSILGIMLSWGSSFESFNYFLFDYLPGYSKFRSVTFTLILFFFAMPLLAMLAVEKVLAMKWTPELKKKLLWCFALTAGVCFLFALAGNIFGTYLKSTEDGLPAWFSTAMRADRAALFRADAWRSFWFILLCSVLLFGALKNWVNHYVFAAVLSILILIDLVSVDNRYFTKDNYQRVRDNSYFAKNEADNFILNDKADFRVFNANYNEARTSYYHQSLGGYHGAPIKRYDELLKAFFEKQSELLGQVLQNPIPNFGQFNVLNMLNARYLVFGTTRNEVLQNNEAYGNAWFIKKVVNANNANEELDLTIATATPYDAIVNTSEFGAPAAAFDSTSSILLKERTPNKLVYEATTQQANLAVFSEIYYPKGWTASIDGQATEIIRANYVLRALPIPAGKHTLVFEFKPTSYYTGNAITMASSWLVLFIIVGTIGWSLRKND